MAPVGWAIDRGVVSNGNWAVSGTWTPAGIPTASDRAFIGANQPAGALAAATVTVSSAASASEIVVGTGGSAYQGDLTIGAAVNVVTHFSVNGSNSVVNHNAGLVGLGNNLHLASEAGATATYNLGPGAVLRVQGDVIMGSGGDGYLNAVTGAQIRTWNAFRFGRNSVNVPAGVIRREDGFTPGVDTYLHVGEWGTTPVSFTQNDTNFLIGGDLDLGHVAGGHGTYVMASNKLLRVNGSVVLGVGENGGWDLAAATGAQLRTFHDFRYGGRDYAPPAGFLKQWEGARSGVGRSLHVAEWQTNRVRFIQPDATFYVGTDGRGGDLLLGNNANMHGTYVMASGQVCIVEGSAVLGNQGDGFIEAATGAVLKTRYELRMSRNDWTPPVGLLRRWTDNSNGVGRTLHVAEGGTNHVTFTQVDGRFWVGTPGVGGDLQVAYNAGTRGTYAMVAGQTNVVESNIYLGQNGDGFLAAPTGAVVVVRGELRVNRNSYTPPAGLFRRADGTTRGVQSWLRVGDVGGGDVVFAQPESVFTVGGLSAGYNTGCMGRYVLAAGQTLDTGDIQLGYSGDGILDAATGATVIARGGLGMSRSSFEWPAGLFRRADGVTPGMEGTLTVGEGPGSATYTQTDPNLHVQGEVHLAWNDGNSDGTYMLGTNRLYVQGNIHVGWNGTANFNLAGGRVGGAGTFYVNNTQQDKLRRTTGFGSITNTRVANTGQIIADGGVLAFPLLMALEEPCNNESDLDDDFYPRERRGWFATNGGELDLPPLQVRPDAGGTNWAERADDPVPDLVNSLRLTFNNVTATGGLDVALLATDHAEVPAKLIAPVGVWRFTRSPALTVSSVDMQFRYDDYAAYQAAVAEADLKLYRFRYGAWEVVPGTTVDESTHLLSAPAVAGFSLFAVAGGVEPQIPVIFNAYPTGVTPTSIVAHAELRYTNQAVTTVFLHWGAADGGTDATNWQHAVDLGIWPEGDVPTFIGGLAPEDDNYYRFLASNAVGVAWADRTTAFATLGPPRVENAPASSVGMNAATLNAELLEGGAATASLYWGTVDGGATAGLWQHAEPIGVVAQEPFSATVPVEPGMTYFYRAYVTNSAGADWADTSARFTVPIAPAATTLIDDSLYLAHIQYNPGPDTVFVNSQTGYVFFIDAPAGVPAYRKSSDGGQTWSSAVALSGDNDWQQLALWYDRWTPGDDTGTKIHLAAIRRGGEEKLKYAAFDTGTETAGAWINANTNIQTGWTDSWGGPSITKSSSGQLFAYIWGSFENVGYQGVVTRSTNGGATWTGSFPVERDGYSDIGQLLPLRNGDVLLIGHRYLGDGAVGLARSKVWHAGTAAWDVDWTPIDGWRYWSQVKATWGAAVDPTSGDVYLVANTWADDPNTRVFGDVMSYRFDETVRAWSAPVRVTHAGGQVMQARAMVDFNRGDVYAVYTRGPSTDRQQVYWQRSTDAGATWGEPSAPLGSNSNHFYFVRGTLGGRERLFAAWYDVNGSFYDLYGATVAVLAPTVLHVSNAAGADPVGATAATLRGEVHESGGANVNAWFAWGTVDGGSAPSQWEHVESIGSVGEGAFSRALNALSPGTRYTYRAFIENAAGTERAFAPAADVFYTAGRPFVDNASGAEWVKATSARLTGTLLSDGDAAPVTARVYWGQQDGGLSAVAWSGTQTVGVVQEGQYFQTDLEELTPGQTYYYRAWASNSLGVGWAESAATFATTGAVRYVDLSAAGANNGSSWTDAFVSLSNALQQAGGADVLWVAQGSYVPGSTNHHAFDIQDKTLYGGFVAGDVWADRDPVTKRATLSGNLGNGNVARHVATGAGTLDGFIVRDGHSFDSDGGGIYVRSAGSGALVLRHCLFTNNLARYGGGAVYVYDRPVEVVVEDCTFADNRTYPNPYDSHYGGAIFVYQTTRPITVRRTTFDGNFARMRGAGLFAQQAVDAVTVEDCVFRGNRTEINSGSHDGGAGVSLEINQWGPGLVVRDSLFTNNFSAAAGASVSSVGWISAVVVSNCQFQANINGAEGGPGIYLRHTDEARILDCDFVGNVTSNGSGGAVFCQLDFRVWPTFANCLFSNNAARYHGGAVYLHPPDEAQPSREMVLTNCVFRNNRNTEPGYSGGAVYAQRGTLRVRDCVFEDNTAQSEAGALYAAGPRSAGLDVVDSVFRRNRTVTHIGGALRLGNGGAEPPLSRIERVVFEGNQAANEGGAVFYDSATNSVYTFADCVFTNNLAGSHGGAVRGQGWFRATNCLFMASTLTAGGGGAVRIYNAERVQIWDCRFVGNTVQFAGEGGGAIRVENQPPAEISRCVFDGNRTYGVLRNGGAIEYGPNAAFTLTDCVFTNNNCTQDGGAVYVANVPQSLVTNCVFANNASAHDGGGLYFGSGGACGVYDTRFRDNTSGRQAGGFRMSGTSLVMEGCDLVRNRQTSGAEGYASAGGAHVYGNVSSVSLSHCLFAQNTALFAQTYGAGGVLIELGEGCTVNMRNCTIADNATSLEGGGLQLIRNGGAGPMTVNLKDSIFWNNAAGAAEPSDAIRVNDGVVLNLSYSGIDTNQVYTPGGGAINTGAGIVNEDPRFAAAVGGDYHLKSRAGRWTASGVTYDSLNSPLIDAGDPLSAYDLEPQPNGHRVNAGRYGNTPQASRTGESANQGLMLIVQ